MKTLFLFLALSISTISFGQVNDKITTIEFVEILNNNKEEAIFYFENNWKVLREMALGKKYIDSYQLLETPTSEEAPFQIILLTTYQNNEQYNLREAHFQELIKEKGELKLLNNKKPTEFRKSMFSKENVRHWN